LKIEGFLFSTTGRVLPR